MSFLNSSFCPSKPDGYRHQNYCYCTSQVKLKYPKFCHVECAQLNFTLSPDGGGCECPEFLAGPRCERSICHYSPSRFYADEYVQLFCMDNYNSTEPVVFENCTSIANLNSRRGRFFPACPCLNGGSRLEESKPSGNTSCVCPSSYYGDMCQFEQVYNRPSPVPTLIVISFLSAVFFILAIALWHRKRQNRKMYAKMYQLEPIVPKRRRVPVLQVPSEDVSAASSGLHTPVEGSRKNSRKHTIADLLDARNFARIARRVKKHPPKQQQQSAPPGRPSVFESTNENNQLAPPVQDEQYGAACYSGGTGMGMTY